MTNPLPSDAETAALVFRIWRPELGGPSLAVLRGGALVDITSRDVPTMRDLLELDDPVAHIRAAEGVEVAPFEAVLANSVEMVAIHRMNQVELPALRRGVHSIIANVCNLDLVGRLRRISDGCSLAISGQECGAPVVHASMS